jgi:hypothetical protein
MAKRPFKLIAGLLLLVLIAGGLWLFYAPAHWLTPFTGTVTVDEHAAQADLYIGNPTHREAEAIAFVHVPGVGDYFLDFEQEKYREASRHEFAFWRTLRYALIEERHFALVDGLRVSNLGSL